MSISKLPVWLNPSVRKMRATDNVVRNRMAHTSMTWEIVARRFVILNNMPQQKFIEPKPVPVSMSQQNTSGQKWLFATNQKNLAYLLASGLLLAKNGFGKKYYRDALDHSADYLPLFRDKVPSEVLDLAVAEKSSLFAVILELDLSQLTGQVLRPQPMGGVEALQFPQALENVDAQIFVKAPLPAQWISKITVANKDHKTKLERDAAELLNIPLQAYKIATNKTLLNGSKKDTCQLLVPEEYSSDPATGIANVVGGILAALARFTDAGTDAVVINRLAFDQAFADWQQVLASDGSGLALSVTMVSVNNASSSAEDGTAVSITDAASNKTVNETVINSRVESGAQSAPVVAEAIFTSLPEWVRQQSGKELAEGGGALLFWSAVDALVHWHNNERTGNGSDAVLHQLEQTLSLLSAPVRDHATEFLNDLRDMGSLGDSTVEDMIDAHTTPMRRGFLLLLLVKNVDHLYTSTKKNRYPALGLADYLAAAILAGARQGWQATPVHDRASVATTNAIQHRMALVAHHATGSATSLGLTPARQPALSELLQANNKGVFTRKQQQAAVMLSRGIGLALCRNTSDLA